MRSLRYITRLLVAFIKRFKAIILVSILVGIGIFLIARFLLPRSLSRSSEQIGVVGRYHPEELPVDILEYISDGLTSVNEDGSVSPAMAESWQAEDEGKKWTFTLKDDLYWQDGQKVTPESLDYQFREAKVTTSDSQITFELETPLAPFPQVVSKPNFKKGLLGVGEWEVTKLSLVSSYVEKMILKNENGDKKVFKFYPTEEEAKNAFKLGHVDELHDLLSPTPFNEWRTASVEENIDNEKIVTIFLNTEDPFLQDKAVRQALSYAVDKQNLADGPRALGPISPSSWAYNPQVKDYAHDLDRAKELMVDFPEDLEVNLEIATVPALLPVAEKVAESWRSLGINATVKVTNQLNPDYQAYLVIFDIPEDPDQYSIWHSTQEGSNISNYNNPRIDKLLEDGRVEMDKETRKKIYLDFQRFLLEDAPAIFLYHPTTYSVQRL